MENTAGFLQKRKLRNGLVKPNLSFLGLAEDKRFEIRLRRFTLFHQASKSQVLRHFFTFTFHQLSRHFTKTKDT